jgi:hypothetical protein
MLCGMFSSVVFVFLFSLSYRYPLLSYHTTTSPNICSTLLIPPRLSYPELPLSSIVLFSCAHLPSLSPILYSSLFSPPLESSVKYFYRLFEFSNSVLSLIGFLPLDLCHFLSLSLILVSFVFSLLTPSLRLPPFLQQPEMLPSILTVKPTADFLQQAQHTSKLHRPDPFILLTL